MAKNLEISVLLDLYGEMLTEKQKDAVDLYYNEDLSLAEIAEHLGITRQGVRDSIKRAENQLLDCEGRLGYVQRFSALQKGLLEIAAIASELQRENAASTQFQRFSARMQRIIEIANKINI